MNRGALLVAMLLLCGAATAGRRGRLSTGGRTGPGARRFGSATSTTSPGDVVQATVYLADIADYSEMNRVCAEYFPTDPPARETVVVSGIVSGA